MVDLDTIKNARPSKAIALETRKGTPIPNAQAIEPDEQALRIMKLTVTSHREWQERKPPCGIYNCAGHVWAARRTAIYEGEDWARILEDDGYRIVDTPTLGDLAVYKAEIGPYLHVGVVAELRQLGTSVIPWILSKWNDSSGEFLHHVHDVIFRPQLGDAYEIRYWTDRPA